jgi:hypothetical protein
MRPLLETILSPGPRRWLTPATEPGPQLFCGAGSASQSGHASGPATPLTFYAAPPSS